ncbi:MAG: flippase [Roseburia sp.]|nr:flippase [Roseburia sp.]
MSSVRRNFSYNLMYQFLSIGSVLLVTPYITRTLGANQTGVYSYTLANAHYFLLFAMLGLNNYGSRQIARAKAEGERLHEPCRMEEPCKQDGRRQCEEPCRQDEPCGQEQQGADKRTDILSRTFWSIYALQFLTAMTAVLCYLGYLLFGAVEDKNIACIQLLYVASALADINWFFFGMEQFKLTVIRNSMVKLASIAAVFLLIKKPGDLWIYTIIMAGSIFISALALWPYLPRFVKPVRLKGREIAAHIKPNLVLFIPVIAISVYNVMDKIMIGRLLHNKAEVSYYDNAYKVMEIPHAFINALGMVMLPKMSALVQKGEHRQGRLYIEKSMHFTLLLAFAVSFGLASVADNLAPVYFGKEFLPCGVLMRWLAPLGVIKSWANVIRTQYLLPNQHDKIYVASVAGGAVVNIIANLLLIPRMGTLGAVIGTLLAETAVMLYQTIYAARELPVGKYIRQGIPYGAAGFIMYLAVSSIGRMAEASLLLVAGQVAAGVFLYGVFIAIFAMRKF